MRLTLLILALSVALAEKPAQPVRVPLIQVGVQAKTETPIMGCPAGYKLWRREVDYAHVSGKPDAQGTIPITVEQVLRWRVSEEQTLLGDIHKRKHHECWPNGQEPK